MTLVFPSKIWDIQTCSQCQKYLSYGPVELSLEGPIKLIKCGRCSAIEDLGTPSIYNIVAQQLVFPCVNRYEGCIQILKFEDVPEHEDGCIGGQYECPLCTASDFKPNSLLYLLRHYTIVHKKSVLSKPSIHLPFNCYFEDSLLYYDNSENILVIIYIQFDRTKLKVNASTVGDRVGKLKYCIRVNKEEEELFVSDYRLCTSFDNNIEVFALELDEASSNLSCNLDFDTSKVASFLFLPEKKSNKVIQNTSVNIEHYGTALDVAFEDADLKLKFPKVNILHSSPILVVENSISYLQSLGQKTHFFCSFCENYCFSQDKHSVLTCSACLKNICNLCRNNCLLVNCGLDWKGESTICVFCKNFYKQLKHNFRCHIRYCCRFGCENWFNGDRLKLHEDECSLNTKAFSDLELAQCLFGKYFSNSSKESQTLILKHNTMLADSDILKNKGKIYMITDIFHCLIFYEKYNQQYKFRIAHNYLPDKFCIVVKMFQHGTVIECSNNFTFNAGQKAFFIVLLKWRNSYNVKQEMERQQEEAAIKKCEEEQKRCSEEAERSQQKQKIKWKWNIYIVIIALIIFFVCNSTLKSPPPKKTGWFS